MKRLLAFVTVAMATACQTPGYDYSSRAAPNYPEALSYTDVAVGRFTGPAGDIAEGAFQALIDRAELQGERWFHSPDPRNPQGIYDGEVTLSGFRREVSFVRERRCARGNLSSCERHIVMEIHCPKEIVDVNVRIRLTDYSSGRLVFTADRGGATEREECYDVAEYADTGQSTGQYGEVIRETLPAWDAPVGMVAEAVNAAIPGFRTDIAPYMANTRAEIVSKPLTDAERADPRFEAAVKATRRGEPIGACAQWEELYRAYPRGPAILHNMGACAEARGEMERAHLLYAEAATVARSIPLLRDKDAQPIFDALKRISRGRHENALIEQASGSDGY